MMTLPLSLLYLVQLRSDLSREDARRYWAGPHADIVRTLQTVTEYRQHHFAQIQDRQWPTGSSLGNAIPDSWRLDGLAEMRFNALTPAARVPLHVRPVMFDEQNVFERVLGHHVGPRGTRQWPPTSPVESDYRAALLLRRRGGVSRRAFRNFVHDTLGPALHQGGALDLRAYVMTPCLPHPTPGVDHTNPASRRYHGVVLFGLRSRDDFDALTTHPAVAQAIAHQSTTCSATHLYDIDTTVPVIGEHR